MAASDSEGGVQGTTPRPVRRKVENEEIKVGWVTVDDDDAPGWGCLTDQNIKEFLDICLLILIVDDFFQTWPLPSTKCGTRHSSWQLPRWDSWLGPVGSPFPASAVDKVVRVQGQGVEGGAVVEGGEQLDSMGHQAGVERVLSQTVSCCFYRALSQVRERASLTLDGMEAFTLLMKPSSPMLMFVHEHLSPPHVVFSLIHHQFGPELSVSLRGKDGRDILTKFSHLPEFDVYQASCQLSKNA